MKRAILLLTVFVLTFAASGCQNSDVTGTMTMNSSGVQEKGKSEAGTSVEDASPNVTVSNTAVTDLDKILEEIRADIQPGTAGSSLTSVRVAADLLDWGTKTTLNKEDIKSETVRWLSDKGNEEQLEFSQKLETVYDAYQQLLGENGEELLTSSGYNGSGYPWGSSPVEAIEALVDTVQLPDNSGQSSDTGSADTQDAENGENDGNVQTPQPSDKDPQEEVYYPGPDVAELVNLRGDTTTVYKLADGRYMDRINAVYLFDGVDTWTDEAGVEWNEAVPSSDASESVQDPYDLYSWDEETGSYIPYQQAEGAGEPVGKGNGWYYYDEEAGTYLPW